MIWQTCQGEQQIKALSGQLYRLVQSQEQAATLSLVDTLEEQALLEQLLEQSAPSCADEAEPAPKTHYLLRAPFRSPPLKWGSRFGNVYEPGIFYGGCSVNATLAESAYYRQLFWHTIQAAPVKPVLRTAHTLFNVGYATKCGIAIHQAPFSQHQTVLTSKADYQQTQQLGSDMRAAGVQMFEYQSARSATPELCAGLFTPAVFTSNQPNHSSPWVCELRAEQVSFKQAGDSTVYQYPAAQFMVNGSLPLPA